MEASKGNYEGTRQSVNRTGPLSCEVD